MQENGSDRKREYMEKVNKVTSKDLKLKINPFLVG